MTAIISVPRQLEQQRHTLQVVLEQIPAFTSPEEIRDLKGRLEAAKAWAKVHKQTKYLRLDLLKIEIAALVHVVNLCEFDRSQGVPEFVTSREWDAGVTYAEMSDEEITTLLGEYAGATTASGILSLRDRTEKYAEDIKGWNSAFSSNTPYPTEYDEPVDLLDGSPYDRKILGERIRSVYKTMDLVLREYTEDGAPFTVNDVAEAILETSSLGQAASKDKAVTRGLREVVRESVGRHVVKEWNGTVIPQFITVQIDMLPPKYVRVPVMNAKISDLDSMISIREEQLRQDRIAYERLCRFRDLLLANEGVTATSNIGQIINKSMNDTIENGAAA